LIGTKFKEKSLSLSQNALYESSIWQVTEVGILQRVLFAKEGTLSCAVFPRSSPWYGELSFFGFHN